MISLVLLLLPADPVEGRWCWNNDQLITVGPGGDLISSRGARGAWKVDDAGKKAYRFSWDSARSVDHLTLNSTGLSGINSVGSSVRARRVPDRVVGHLAWNDRAVVTLAANGEATSNRGRGGTWTVVDATKGIYRLSWTAALDELELSPVEELTLTPDGLALMGPQAKVTGYRLSTPIMGSWTWADGKEVVVRPDGVFGGPNLDLGVGGWRAVDAKARSYQLDWGTKQLDTVTLSADGLRLEGKTDAGHPVSATKKPDEVVGSWSWSDGRKVTVSPDGTLRANGKRDPWDSWLVIDATSRRYGFAWDDGDRVESLELSADGLRLEGEDTRGAPVSATRKKK